jgi:hypothetical protein
MAAAAPCVAPAAPTGAKRTYVQRRPERSVLYQLVREHLETFLEQGRQRSAHGEGYPRYVEQTFRRYLQCGILAHGCARLHCASCGHDIFVPFSCKGRGLCPSCQGRRMNEVAATLCDTLLPQLPYRQWVFTYPMALRRAMARDPTLLTAVLQRSVRTLAAYQRRRARALAIEAPQTAALCALQRFGSAINLNVHAHVIAPDAVFVVDGAALRPVVLPPPTDAEVAQLALGVQRRIRRLLARRSDEADAAADVEPTPLDHALSEALAPKRRVRQTDAWPPPARPRCASVDSFGVHADVAIAAEDRQGLERLVRYVLRPPLAHRRLERLASGRIRYQLKHPWYDGSTHLELDPLALMRRLALLIPPPRQHTLRYQGLFAPHAKHRAKLAALLPAVADTATPSQAESADQQAATPTTPQAASRRWRWAALLRRVFSVDVESCPRCESPLQLIALITEAMALTRIIAHLGLSTPPPPEPARLPEQTAWDFEPEPSALDTADAADPSARAPPELVWLCLPDR